MSGAMPVPMTPVRNSRVSRAQIARAALQIIDKDGLDGLSMRRVAAKLGVGTMTLYGHFRSKDELLDAVIDEAVEPHGLPTAKGPWRDQIRELLNVAHRNLTAHPALVHIRFRQPVLRPEALKFGEAGMGILRAAGFPAADAAGAFRLLFTYTFGYSGLSPEASSEEARRQAAAAVAGLAPDEYPNLVDTAPEFSAAMAGQKQFEYGVERILDGLEARLRELKRSAAPAG